MELRLILAAIRRSRLIILVTTIALTVPAVALWFSRTTTWEAKSVLYIQPPAATGSANINYNDPDRYVISQLGVLESASLASVVAKQLKSGDVKAIQRSVTFSHTPKTDLITVLAKHPNPEMAKAIANGFSDVYIRQEISAVKKGQEPAIVALQKRIDAITSSLEEANKRVAADVTDQVAALERDNLNSELGEVVRAKTSLEFIGKVEAKNAVLDRATTAVPSPAASLPLQVAAGLFLGLALGTAIALAIMVFSPTIADSGQVEELLGNPPIGPVRMLSNFPKDSSTIALRAGWPFANVAKNIAIRTEAVAPQSSATLTVGVVSAFPKTGVTSIATAIAGYFGRSGSQVLLVDANDTTPTISTEFNATEGEKFVRYVDESIARQTPIELNWLNHVLVPSSVENMRVLGSVAKFLHRGNLPSIMKTLRNFSKVTIIDCPAMENSPTSVRLSPLVDVIVYVVPINRVRQADLKTGIAQFRETPVIVVLTKVGARQFFFG
jgi:capsular polysaccharide biosynthesis protein/Mrp family chromosome partitioning ATPase